MYLLSELLLLECLQIVESPVLSSPMAVLLFPCCLGCDLDDVIIV